MERTRTIWKINKKGHIRIIPANLSLVKIQPVVKKEMSFEAIVDDARLTTDIQWIQKLTLKYQNSHNDWQVIWPSSLGEVEYMNRGTDRQTLWASYSSTGELQ